jgi:FMN-dependent NADH-azoreductase
MPTLLALQASPRGSQSISGELTGVFITQWQRTHPEGQVVVRELSDGTTGYLDALWVQAVFVPPAQRTPQMNQTLAESDELTAELMAADEIVVGTPMYNFAVPATLKAWIDLIVRFGVTFTLDGGLLPDRPVTAIVSSRGEYTPGAPDQNLDFVTPYLKHIFSYIGLTSFTAVQAGDFISLRTGRITREDHIARYRPAVLDAATRPDNRRWLQGQN